jgi:hypothetical protein
MSVTTFPLVAAGWRAAVGWLAEVEYGMAPAGIISAPQAYNWVGAVQSMRGTVDKQPIFVYRMDGSTSFPAYILKGQRNVDFSITYWPQNIGGGSHGVNPLADGTQGILWDMINAIGTPAGSSLSPPVTGISHSFIIKDFDTGAVWTVTGAIANTVTISGKTGAALEVKVDYWCQNIMQTLPAYVTFPTDLGDVPFYFSQEAVQIPSGSVAPQALTFTATITNNLSRVPQFGTDVIRSLPTLTRKAEGDMTATFATMADVALETNVPATAETYTPPTTYTDLDTTLSGLAMQTIRVILGKFGLPSATSPTYISVIDFTGAVLPKIDLTVPIADRVALDLPWYATGASVHVLTP